MRVLHFVVKSGKGGWQVDDQVGQGRSWDAHALPFPKRSETKALACFAWSGKVTKLTVCLPCSLPDSGGRSAECRVQRTVQLAVRLLPLPIALWLDLTLAMTIGRAGGEPVGARRGADLHAMYVPLHGCAVIYISHGLTFDVAAVQ